MDHLCQNSLRHLLKIQIPGSTPDINIRLFVGGVCISTVNSPHHFSVYQSVRTTKCPQLEYLRDQSGDTLYFTESRCINYRLTIILCVGKREKLLSIKNDLMLSY